jgi:hypothetical protein
VYGVVVADGTVDAAATAVERDRLRSARKARSRPLGEPRGSVDVSGARRIDDNLVELSGGEVACGHCGQGLGEVERLGVALYEGPPTDAGPQILADCGRLRRRARGVPAVLLPVLLDGDLLRGGARRPPRRGRRPLKGLRRCRSGPSAGAVATAREREGSWSLRSTADTWCATVFSERTKRPAICALDRPSESA